MIHLRAVFLYIFAIFFVIAGLNHFLNPGIYISLVPPYLPFPWFLNYFTGAAELTGGAMLLFERSRKAGAIILIVLLVLFIPAHIYMIQRAPFYLGDILVTPMIARIRLPLQFLLIFWGYQYSKR